MADMIRLGEIAIAVKIKNIKHVYLSVHPPSGRVTLVAPSGTRLEVARAYATSRLTWIRRQREQLRQQAREAPRRFIDRESHYLWGRRYLLTVVEQDSKPAVKLDHRRIWLTVRPGSARSKRQEIIHAWHRAVLHEAVPALVKKWERKLQLKLSAYHLQRMKTKWGSCNHRAGTVRLNTELVKKPRDLLEYVIAHEMIHLIEPRHSERFVGLMNMHYPTWREARAELNELPLSAETWLIRN
jgi:predicted metal-dependent hydrolase